jgi:hypothetical protein
MPMLGAFAGFASLLLSRIRSASICFWYSSYPGAPGRGGAPVGIPPNHFGAEAQDESIIPSAKKAAQRNCIDMIGRAGGECESALALVGVVGDVRNAGYIATWIELLKADKRAFFTACNRASKAADYLRGIALADPAEIAA